MEAQGPYGVNSDEEVAQGHAVRISGGDVTLVNGHVTGKDGEDNEKGSGTTTTGISKNEMAAAGTPGVGSGGAVDSTGPKKEATEKTKTQETIDHTSTYGSIISGMATTVDAARKYGVGIEKAVEIGGKITSKVINRIGIAGIAVTWINVAAGNESFGRGVVQIGIAGLGFIPSPITVGASILLTGIHLIWGDDIEKYIRGK